MLLAHCVSLIVSPCSSVGFPAHYFQPHFPLLCAKGPLLFLPTPAVCSTQPPTPSWPFWCFHLPAGIMKFNLQQKCSLGLLFFVNLWFLPPFRSPPCFLSTCFLGLLSTVLLFLCPSPFFQVETGRRRKAQGCVARSGQSGAGGGRAGGETSSCGQVVCSHRRSLGNPVDGGREPLRQRGDEAGAPWGCAEQRLSRQ